MADEREAEKRDIADQVQDLVADELVLEAQARFIHDTVFGQNHGVVQCPAFSEASGPQGFDFVQKSKRASRCNILLKSRGGAGIGVGLGLDQWMIVVNGVRDLRGGRRLDSDSACSINNLNGLRDFHIRLATGLGDHAGRTNQSHEGARAAIQHGDFPCICLLYTSPSPRDRTRSRMPSSA